MYQYLLHPFASRRSWSLGLLLLTAAQWAAAAEAAAPAAAKKAGIMGDTLWDTFQRGGLVMWPILGCSVLGLMLLFENGYRMRRNVVLPKKTDELLQSAGGRAAVAELVAGNSTICINRILRAGYRWRKGTHEQIQAAIEEAVDELMWQYKRAARPLGIVANVAPLLGLLGTVTGIIAAFDVIARQGAVGDPSALANGIAEALLTTVFGLIVAIPMLLAYHYYVNRIEALLRRCEELAKEALILPPE